MEGANMSDMTDKMSGKAKEFAGKATGNRKQELKGKMQHKTADVKQKANDYIDNISQK